MKYRFKIWYQPAEIIKVNEFMVKCDLFAEGHGVVIEDSIQFEYTGKDKPISYFQDIMKYAFQSTGGKLIKCEGGPFE